MKHILFFAMFIPTAVMANDYERPDTVMSVTNPASVSITESPEGFSVSVVSATAAGDTCSGYSESFEAPVRVEAHRTRSPLSYCMSRDNRWDLIVGGPGIGWVNACGQPDGMNAEMGKSLEISWLNVISVRYRLPWHTSTISFGFGFDWRNYRISTGETRFIPTDAGGVALGGYPEGVEPEGSRLKVFSMGVPIVWHQSLPFKIFGNDFSFGIGAVFNYNSHASLKTKWLMSDGAKAEQTSDHIGHRRFTVDFLATVRVWGGISLYVRYSPNSVLRGAGQPKFTPLSSGIVLFY